MKKVIIYALAFGVGFYLVRPSDAAFIGTHEENVAELQEIAAEINRDLPKRLDEWTTLLRVEANDAGFVNHYRVHAESLNRFNDIWEILRERACDNRGYRHAMAAGFSITFSYENNRGTPLTYFEVRDRDCPET